MKKTRRIAAFIAAMAMAATLAVPSVMMSASAAMVTEGNGNTITITNEDSATHIYAAYQIFSGNFSGDTLNDIAWGDGVNGPAIVSALDKASTTEGNVLYGLFPAVTDAESVAGALGAKTTGDPATAVFDTDGAKAQAFAAIVGANLTETTSGTYSSNSISKLPDGYYLVLDSAAPSGTTNNSGAKTRFIVRVTDGTTVAVNAKHAAPTVDKEVFDNDDGVSSGDNNGWGETADHAINEEFDFKLTATLAKDADYVAYDTYRVLFTDTLNAGVTYDRIKSVKVNGNDVTAYDATTAKSGYKVTAPEVTSPALGGGTLKISIGDVKRWLGSTAWADTNDSGVTVEVIYTAHLNENAAVEKASNGNVEATYANVNKVKLNYSNNPNVEGSGDSGDTPGDNGNEEEFGETPEDYVWVFTYEVDNTKYKESVADANKLDGAGFTLYSDSGKTTAIKLIDNQDGTYTVANQKATTGFVTQMTSSGGATTKGQFNIKGLDAGTYYLVETDVPSGYNKCDDITITIGATHEENTGGSTAKLTFSGSNTNNNIVNNKGSQLPSTGGMGTKAFVAGGGLTALLAGVWLATKKRMGKED